MLHVVDVVVLDPESAALSSVVFDRARAMISDNGTTSCGGIAVRRGGYCPDETCWLLEDRFAHGESDIRLKKAQVESTGLRA